MITLCKGSISLNNVTKYGTNAGPVEVNLIRDNISTRLKVCSQEHPLQSSSWAELVHDKCSSLLSKCINNEYLRW